MSSSEPCELSVITEIEAPFKVVFATRGVVDRYSKTVCNIATRNGRTTTEGDKGTHKDRNDVEGMELRDVASALGCGVVGGDNYLSSNSPSAVVRPVIFCTYKGSRGSKRLTGISIYDDGMDVGGGGGGGYEGESEYEPPKMEGREEREGRKEERKGKRKRKKGGATNEGGGGLKIVKTHYFIQFKEEGGGGEGGR